MYKDASLPSRNIDLAQPLNNALARHHLTSLLEGLPPAHPQYQNLVAALAVYRAIAAQGGWPLVSNEQLLVRRLALEDPLLAAQPASSADDVNSAIERYQVRNGLAADGKLGPETMRALNVPVAVRIGQIIANMERWRWMPAELERRRVEVNVPDQSLDLMDGFNNALHSRVIIGKRSTPTPLLRTVAVSVVANPAWDIPDDIAVRQLLPHLRQNANYLASRNMDLVGAPADTVIDWRQISGSHLPYQIRQPPGPNNGLGHLMLDSPNSFDVYMHDTPDKTLFQKPLREISNGCIRVELIDQLASLALNDDEALGDALRSGETRTMALREPLPVYLLYWTAIAAEDGTVGFRPDRYGRDIPLMAGLTAK